ncbi:putative protein kinase RLK-Pelle-DLSV family [Dioscorea sansibarensis]
MACPTQTLLFLLLLLLLASPALSDTVYQSCETAGNYTTNSTYQSNLLTLLHSLYSNGSISGFYDNTMGTEPNKIYGMVLCRGDTNMTTCRNCLDAARQDVIQICPNNKGALVWYDPCFLRYSNQNFLSSTDNSNSPILLNTQKVSDEPFKYTKLVIELMDTIAQFASYNSSRKFATWEVNFTVSDPKIYGLTQCTPDLSGDQCYKCLQRAFNAIPNWVDSRGLRVIGVRCNFRYELYPFYEGKSTVLFPASSPPSPSSGTNTTGTTTVEEGSSNHVGMVALFVVLPFLASVVLVSVIYFVFRRRTDMHMVFLPENGDETLLASAESKLFDLSILREATDNFSDANTLGEGGFGPVYKGALKDGQEIAVKRLSRTSEQGLLELRNEVVFVANLQHRNLVRLLGCCLEENEKLLVYEYLSNTSLDKILFDPVRRQVLEWCTRYRIIEGISRGLLYLHVDSRLRIIHRDLKASNILLDKDMNPKISDFGLAKHFGANETHKNTTRIAGTYGYMAPEYAIYGVFSTKSDVYSYGVLILEIVTGRKNSDFKRSNPPTNLLSHVWQRWNEGNALELVDQILGNRFIKEQVLRCIHIGLLCVQEDPTKRPSMASVVNMLSSHSIPLPTSTAPAFFIAPDLILDFVNEEDVNGYKHAQMVSENEVSISEMDPR